MAIENSGDRNLTPAEFVGNEFKIQTFACFSVKEGLGGNWEAVYKASLSKVDVRD